MGINTEIIVPLLTFATAAIAAWKAWKVGQRVHELHLEVNSRLSELIELTAKNAHARGLEAGRKEGRTSDSDSLPPPAIVMRAEKERK